MGQGLHAFAVGSQFEAQIAQDYLADNGIKCVIRCDEIPLQPGFSFGLEGWGSLLVPEDKVVRARELLSLIPGVGQEEEECSDKAQNVSSAFQLQLPSVTGLGFICLTWFLAWEIIWLLPGTPDWIWTIGVLPLAVTWMQLIILVISMTNFGGLCRELKRATPALLAALALILFSPIWLILNVPRWSFQAFKRLRIMFTWLAKLPEHLSD